MKYVVVQGDGMADHPQEELSGQTPLEAAETPNMDSIASTGVLGRVTTVPEGTPPGSAVGNLSLMGLDPKKYYSGRAPLEAKGLGVAIEKTDIAFRCNLVRFGKNGDTEIMEDYSGGHPSPQLSNRLIDSLDKELGNEEFRFYPGVSYRNVLIWKGGNQKANLEDINLTPPHDITGEPVLHYLPEGPGSQRLNELQNGAKDLLGGKDDEINGVWFWGTGIKPDIPTLQNRYGLGGAVISAVDLVRGLGSYAGLSPVEVKGATGLIDTNYEGKVQAVKDNIADESLIYLHIEAPDEASHMGKLELKLEAIERIDRRVVGPLIEYLREENDARLLLATDHITGIKSRTHERGPVPFAIFEPQRTGKDPRNDFSEKSAAKTGREFPNGHELMNFFILEGQK